MHTNNAILNLSKNYIGDSKIKQVCDMLRINDVGILYLNLSFCNITDKGIKYLSRTLKNTCLTDLNLSYNWITSKGAKYLAKVMHKTKITNLDLSNNWIGCSGIKCLFDKMCASFIESLNMSNNNADDKSTKYICRCLKKNNKLRALNLDENYKITCEGTKMIIDALSINFTLVNLVLDLSEATEDDKKWIIKKIKNNYAITNLGFIRKQVGDTLAFDAGSKIIPSSDDIIENILLRNELLYKSQ